MWLLWDGIILAPPMWDMQMICYTLTLIANKSFRVGAGITGHETMVHACIDSHLEHAELDRAWAAGIYGLIGIM